MRSRFERNNPDVNEFVVFRSFSNAKKLVWHNSWVGLNSNVTADHRLIDNVMLARDG